MSATYLNSRPDLTIVNTGSRQLGNCWSSTTFTVTSTYRLSKDKLVKLRNAGFFGFGQDFFIHSKCDGTEEPAGHDVVECVDTDTGKPAVRYDGTRYPPASLPYFTYNIEDRNDSSD